MRYILSTLLVASVAMAFAGPGKPVTCAVMTKNEVKVADATKAHKYVDYKGKRYYFCCGDCAAMFKKDPAKYAKNGHPIPKTKKS
jgi:YHS domain-containing protein